MDTQSSQTTGTSSSNFLGTESQPAYTPTSDERMMAMMSHILCFVAGFLAPLVIYLMKKDESQFVTSHAKEALNFQITVFLAFIACFILMFILIGLLLIWVVGLAATVFTIIATIRASENKLYRYPISIRFIK